MAKWLALAGVVWVLDRITKVHRQQHVGVGPGSADVPDLQLGAVAQRRRGVQLPRNQSGWQRWMLVALAIAFSIYLVIEMRRLPAGDKLTGWAYGFVLGGALGNLWDRAVQRLRGRLRVGALRRPLFSGVQRGGLGDLDRRSAVDRCRCCATHVASAQPGPPDAPDDRGWAQHSCDAAFLHAARERRGGRFDPTVTPGDVHALATEACYRVSSGRCSVFAPGADEQLRIPRRRWLR